MTVFGVVTGTVVMVTVKDDDCRSKGGYMWSKGGEI